MDKTCNNIAKWLNGKVFEANAKGIIFGLSGGIDSAVLAGLSKIAFPEDSLGLIMPCHSNPVDEEHALLVADSLDLKVEKVDLTETYDQLLQSLNLEGTNNLATANIKPRLRMITLYYYAQTHNYLVTGASNKSEIMVGYFTKHGDSGVDLLPLASFTKTEIREMARCLNIPKIIINKSPTAGLWKNQTDEKEMGFGYDVLDNYIKKKTGPKDIVEKIDTMYRKSEHKRNFPPIYVPKDYNI
ncbi:NAD(+) synthase [Schnuerera sp. xch1]|uniref:NAD(+) synthase n=1 Tax=Schnuerera sp. xch1 TaxID=2874283 RepID=UPI001CBFF2D1|nr:NAD(+) synthase [Schnuerera sp. xch1]MBZ2173646.1 NAD(+) synthase [Schnuerera sp. xch1]